MLKRSTQSVELRTTLLSGRMMKSVRFHGPRDVRIDEVEEPICGKGQVKVRPTPILQGMILMNPFSCDRPMLGSAALVGF